MVGEKRDPAREETLIIESILAGKTQITEAEMFHILSEHSEDESDAFRDLAVDAQAEQAAGIGDKVLKLDFGSKILFVREHTDVDEFSTYIVNDQGKLEKKQEGQTTLLYKAAKELMQLVVNETKKPAKYIMSSYNETMNKWADGPGNDIFKWDDVIPLDDTTLEYHKTFTPQSIN